MKTHEHGSKLGTARHGIVSAIFRDADDAESAYRETRDGGYGQEEITVLMSEQARDEYFPSEDVVVERESKTLKGTGAGGVIGAAVGALAGAIAAIGTTILIPGLGLVVAGPLAAAIAGAGAGGVTGGLIGAFVGAGMSEERARVYHTAIEEGGIVMTVTPHSAEDAEWIAKAWEDCGAEDVYRSA
ncbi:MAG TPA: hypothetical protein VFH11_14880 [Gemmatimonadota bacterium]|nr:hypothetical protein [Gemmatimonadota bacterium]